MAQLNSNNKHWYQNAKAPLSNWDDPTRNPSKNSVNLILQKYNLSKHASSPYNPNIAHVFYLAGFIESWGRGIEKICSACEKDGVPQPEYTINPGDIMIKFTAPEDRVIRVTERVTVKVTDRVTDKEQELLSLLIEDLGYTMPQLAERLSVSRKTVAARLKKLKDAGLIERVGSDRKGYWKLLK